MGEENNERAPKKSQTNNDGRNSEDQNQKLTTDETDHTDILIKKNQ